MNPEWSKDYPSLFYVFKSCLQTIIKAIHPQNLYVLFSFSHSCKVIRTGNNWTAITLTYLNRGTHTHTKQSLQTCFLINLMLSSFRSPQLCAVIVCRFVFMLDLFYFSHWWCYILNANTKEVCEQHLFTFTSNILLCVSHASLSFSL